MSTSVIEFSQFCRLSDPLASRPFRLAPEDEWINRKMAFKLIGGEQVTSHPIRMRATMGGQPSYVLWSTFSPFVCIHQRVVELLSMYQFRGWSTYPVEVYDRQGEPLADYWGLAITGRGGEQDLNRSELITKPPPVPGGKPYQAYKGFYFNPQAWDGSDLFFVDGFRIVREAVMKAFKRAKIANVRFTALPDVEIDAAVYRVTKSTQ